MRIDIIDAEDERRPMVEALIHDRFQEVYAADVHHFMPKLLYLQSKEGEAIAALGFRPAAMERLFLEHYLDAPIEQILTRKTGRHVERASIVEVGNLADLRSGGARAAIVAVTAFLYGQGYRWVTFTGIPTLFNAFYRLGLEPETIAEADPARLSESERKEWGHYYDARPKVMYGDIHQGQEALEYSRKVLHPLWETAARQGREQRCDGDLGGG